MPVINKNKDRNSWANLTEEGQGGSNKDVQKERGEKASSFNIVKHKKIFKGGIEKIKSHKSVSQFCGELSVRQQILFGIVLSLWFAFNVYNLVAVTSQVLDKNANLKIVTTERKVNEVEKKYGLPTVGFMGCASNVKLLIDAKYVNETTLNAESSFSDGNKYTIQKGKCKIFTTPSKFNNFKSGLPVECCGFEIPKSIYHLPDELEQMRQNPNQFDITFTAKGTTWIGIFSRGLKEGETVMNTMDPAVDFMIGGRAEFSSRQVCHYENNESTTDYIQRNKHSYLGIKFLVEVQAQGIVPVLIKEATNIMTSLVSATETEWVRVYKNTKCKFKGIEANRLEVFWTVSMLGAFQANTATVNRHLNIISLQGGLGSAFGLLNTTMLAWALLFPMTSKKNPAVRRAHPCFGKYCCKSWAWSEEGQEEEAAADSQ
jgi:hypothetical protein